MTKGIVILTRLYKVLSLSLMLVILQSNLSLALSGAFKKPETGVFSSYDVMRFHLRANFSTLLNAKKGNPYEAKKVKVPGVLSYLGDNKKWVSLKVELNIKGFSSIQFCSFPKLEIKLPKGQLSETIFAGMKSVDLNTHCVEKNDSTLEPHFKTYAEGMNSHREPTIYRIMEELDMPSFRARPILIQYSDLEENSLIKVLPNTDYHAFLLEDYGDFRKRNQLKVIRGIHDPSKFMIDPLDSEKMSTYVFSNVSDSTQVDREDVARSALLQYLVGNTDWYIKKTKQDSRFEGDIDGQELWNMKLVENIQGKWITFPQDFNFSFFITGFPFRTPLDTQTFELASEASRLKILESFLNKKNQIYEIVRSMNGDDSEALIKGLEIAFAEIQQMHLDLKK